MSNKDRYILANSILSLKRCLLMDDPSYIVINNPYLIVIMHGKTDIPKKYVPMNWWLNPLRYEVTLFKPQYIQFNKEGAAYKWVSNQIFRLKMFIRLDR